MTSIDTNLSSTIAQNQFSRAGLVLNATMQKMATGSRINRGGDDPAGLISSEQLRAALATLDVQSRAIERADAVANVADGALAEVSGLLNEANAVTVAMANTAGMSQAERDADQMEIDSAMQAVDRIASTTTFNGQRVLDGSMTVSVWGASVTIGSAATSGIGRVTIDGAGHTLAGVKSGGALDPNVDPEGAQQALGAAISQVATLRGQIGAFQKDALGPQFRSNRAAMENTASAYSAVRDTDYAAESAALARGRVLRASTLHVLAMANSSPRSALLLLG